MDSKIEMVLTKASGLAEPFSIKKLGTSLARAKVTSEEIKVIIGASIPNLYKGISTKKFIAKHFAYFEINQNHRLRRFAGSVNLCFIIYNPPEAFATLQPV